MNKLKNVFIYIVTISITFLVSEFGFRYYLSKSQIYEMEMHKYALQLKRKSEIKGLTHEHINNSSSKLMGVDVSINSNGCRDNELTGKNNNEYRIMLMGSSITLGWGVDNKDIFSTLLENQLNKIQSKSYYNIYNNGVGNYNTEKEKILFLNKVNNVKPDEVWLHYFVNDAEILPSTNSNWLIKNSYLSAFIFARYKQSQSLKSSAFNSIGEYYLNLYTKNKKGWRIAQKSILEMKSYCDQNNIKFNIIVQPDLHDLSSKSDQAKVHLIIDAFLKKNSIGYIDLFSTYQAVLGKKSPQTLWVSADDSHPNKIGHEIIFKTLFQDSLKFKTENK